MGDDGGGGRALPARDYGAGGRGRVSGVDSMAFQPDYDAAHAFRLQLPRAGRWALLSIAPEGGPPTPKFFGREEDERPWLIEQGATNNAYYALNPLRRRPRKGKARKGDVHSAIALHADLDPPPCSAGTSRAEKLAQLGAAREKLLARLTEKIPPFVPPPSVIIDSGGGYQGLWLLRSPFEVLGDPARIADFERYLRALGKALNADPSTLNIDRILRLPGTLNRPSAKKQREKGQDLALARIVSADYAMRYDLTDFAECEEGVGSPEAPRTKVAVVPIATTGVRIETVDDISSAVPLSKLCKDAILQGREAAPDRWPSRSEAVYFVCHDLVRAGCSPEVVKGVITSPAFRISERVIEKGNADAEVARAFAEERGAESKIQRPWIELPNGLRQHRDFALDLAPLLGSAGFYTRGREVVELRKDALEFVGSAKAVTAIERVAVPFRMEKRNGDRIERVPALVSEHVAKVALASCELQDGLPPITAVYSCPVLVARDGKLVVVTGYDRASGIYAKGEAPETMSLEEARAALLDLTCDFKFAEEGDLGRMIAGFLTPALVFGRLLGASGRSPLIVAEADESQAGKGFLVRTLAGIYNAVPGTVAQTRGGVGGLDESLARQLLSGRAFIQIDNVRGRVDSQFLESVMTEPSVECRIPHRVGAAVNPRCSVIMLTSNNAELTGDLAKRSMFVRIRKQPQGYQFRQWPEGGLLDHVQKHQPRLLGAVFAIVRVWYATGKPLAEDDGEHDFRPWARAIRAIVRGMLKLPDPIAGGRVIQRRASDRHAAWVRQVVLAVQRAGMVGVDLRAHEVLRILVGADVEVPCLEAGEDIENDMVRDKCLIALGRRLGEAFSGGNEIEVEDLRFVRFAAGGPLARVAGGTLTDDCPRPRCRPGEHLDRESHRCRVTAGLHRA
ncbi:MAG: hypothetical protein IPM13_18260 [Phycisphaerales bacterium]|nr:hypothetical protein [Phycisphaerales bacterium]